LFRWLDVDLCKHCAHSSPELKEPEMLSRYLLPFATVCAVAAAPANAGTVSGKAKILLGGEAATCSGVALIPRTAESERRVAALFGTVSATSVPVRVEDLRNGKRSDEYERTKEARCSFRSGYRLSNVAPGDYFVTLLARGGRGGRQGAAGADHSAPQLQDTGFREQAVLLMQPVRVSAQGAMIEADFEQR
jgi:hypothetical protein